MRIKFFTARTEAVAESHASRLAGMGYKATYQREGRVWSVYGEQRPQTWTITPAQKTEHEESLRQILAVHGLRKRGAVRP